jgi:signal transduction histidine kinase
MAKLVLLVTTDRVLVNDLTPSMSARSLELFVVPTARDAAVRLGTQECAGVVVDAARVPQADRDGFLQLHKSKPFPLVLIEPPASASPAESMPLRRLAWPLPQGFTDQVRAVDRPIVFLVDKPMYASNGVTNALRQSGSQPVALESSAGLIEFVQKQQAEQQNTPKPQPVRQQSIWDKLSGAPQTQSDAPPVIGKVVVALHPGSLAEAEAIDARLRQSVPNAVCYYVFSLDRMRAAARALQEGFPASVMRDEAGKIAGLFSGDQETVKTAANKEKERVLLLDNHKPHMEGLGQALLGAGYEVTMTLDPKEAMRLGSQRGAFHMAIIGGSVVAELSGPLMAQKFREYDNDMRIILMVDQYPIKEALKGISQVVELGLDDALLKPVEASRLIFSVQRALERRFLLLENKRLLIEVQESYRKLEQVNGFQKKFFAMVAHDVKNPLTAILGYSEVLGMRLANQPDFLKLSAHIHSAAKTLNALISDLVDLAAIESGKLRVEMGPLDIAAVVSEVKSRIDVVAQQRKINFQVQLPPQIPALIGDPHRVGQVVQNLCTNAIQYTKEGGSVTIRVDVEPHQITVGVQDTGIGISKEDLPRVFERFFQTKEAQNMRKAGFGLGLKIAREIVQMHGGDIGLESELGVGSRFYFTIPVKK